MDDDETLTAYHEAGHAVVGYALGGRVASMQLGGQADEYLPERFGDCRLEWGRVDPESNWQRQREILTILAGPVAEMIYRGELVHPALYGQWQQDWQLAWVTSETLRPEPSQRVRLLERLTAALDQQMRAQRCWAAIAALADELAAHQVLEEDQVAEVLEFWFAR